MHNLRKCLGIDIGTTSIKVVEIVSEKTGARVTKYFAVPIPLAPGPLDPQRIEVVAKTIRDALKDQKISTKHAVFCISGQNVFVRKVRLPRTTEERLHRIIAYEARQQIPFALENAIVEYQVFDLGPESELEVLLVAAKKDLVNDFMKLVGKTGLKPVTVSVSSFALFNFQVFDATPFERLCEELGLLKRRKAKTAAVGAEGSETGDKGKKFTFKLPSFSFGKKKAQTQASGENADELPEVALDESPAEEEIFEEVRAYINIGAQTFDLAIARLGKYHLLGFTRSVPWGGMELTRTLQDRLEITSAEEAEEIKRSRAVVVIPGREQEIEGGDVDPEASEIVTSWADRLILDIRKSLDYYISQPDGVAVDSISLSGGQAVQPNLAAYIEEKLGIPVEIKSHVENEALRVPISEEESAGIVNYCVALGLGLTGLGYGRITIDFLPRELKTLREFKKKNIELTLLTAGLAAMITVSTQVGQRDITNMRRWLDENQMKIQTAAQTRAKVDEARQKRDKVNAKFTALGEAFGDRGFWLEFLGMLQNVKPADVLITAIQMKPDGEVTIECEAENLRSLLDFVKSLKAQTEWVKAVVNSNVGDPTRVRFSNFVGKQVQTGTITLQVHWKKTRLAPVRQTLEPGLMYPTPPPATPAQPRPAMGAGAGAGIPGEPAL
ncbi:MAG: pilus assembly protein PilM [Candidatus Sumerlaeaceae bacterium]|nr:pilus assembly protein PilM [Candidatus Sumerlaeaceae bacterium]